MKYIGYALSVAAIAVSLQSHACKILLVDNIQLPLNAAEVSNSDRLALTRHYLTAREWTTEGAIAQVDAAAFESERNPKQLAALRGENVRAFLTQLGVGKDDVYVHERVVELNKGKINPDDKWQIGVEFVPKCPSSGCGNLCNTPNLRGVASYAVTPDTPGPSPESYRFTCGDTREPTNARILEKEVWTSRTEEKSLTLNGVNNFGKRKPLVETCYRVTTSAQQYVGVTDDQGRTERMQLLGPEYTKIEMKVDADRLPVKVSD
jgi:hypothetical protein